MGEQKNGGNGLWKRIRSILSGKPSEIFGRKAGNDYPPGSVAQEISLMAREYPFRLCGVSSTSDPTSIRAVFAGASGKHFAVSVETLSLHERRLITPFLETKGHDPHVNPEKMSPEVRNHLLIVEDALDMCRDRFGLLTRGGEWNPCHPTNFDDAGKMAEQAVRKMIQASSSPS